MAQAYAVVSGYYSDYAVVGVFSTPEKRAAFLAQYTRVHDARTEDFAMDPEIPEIYEYIEVTMGRDGGLVFLGEKFDDEKTRIGFKNIDATYFTWWVHTTDKTRAVKVVNEKRAQLIAAGLWPIGPWSFAMRATVRRAAWDFFWE